MTLRQKKLFTHPEFLGKQYWLPDYIQKMLRGCPAVFQETLQK